MCSAHTIGGQFATQPPSLPETNQVTVLSDTDTNTNRVFSSHMGSSYSIRREHHKTGDDPT